MALSTTLLSCGPDVFTGAEVSFIAGGERFELDTDEEIVFWEDSPFPDSFYTLWLEEGAIEIGWPSHAPGIYDASEVYIRRLERHDGQDVRYTLTRCEDPQGVIRITESGYGLITGFFTGRLCRFADDPGPETLTVSGNFVASVRDRGRRNR